MKTELTSLIFIISFLNIIRNKFNSIVYFEYVNVVKLI